MIDLSEDTPFQVQLSFSEVLDRLEKRAADLPEATAAPVKALLLEAAAHPDLRNGVHSMAQLEQFKPLLKKLLADYFPEDLTLNEIKAITIPYRNIIFNHSQRLQNLLDAAGKDFSIQFSNFSEHEAYVSCCCLILNEFYGTNLDFSKPLFYEIPSANGIIKYYRILYNADFMDLEPTDKAVPLSKTDIEQLLDNYEDLALWKEKFPVGSWLLKGFAIMTLFDATVENAVSILKEKLLAIQTPDFREQVESVFRSIYRLPDLRVGFTAFNCREEQLSPNMFGQQLQSFMLAGNREEAASNLLCNRSYHDLIKEKTYFASSDVLEWQKLEGGKGLATHLLSQDIRSCIIAPIVKNGQLFGFLEVVSPRARELNSVNANKLEVVMSFITDTVERLAAELENQVQAVIQEQYTTIHNSVNWKFRNEAHKYIAALQTGTEYEPREIIFPDVHPLYGQVDIKGSSDARNKSVQKDISEQLQALLPLLRQVKKKLGDNLPDDVLKQVKAYLAELALPLKAGTEQYVSSYLNTCVHPLLKEVQDTDLLPGIDLYFIETNKEAGAFHAHRRRYESTITLVNKKLAAIIDSRQPEAQVSFPHYYERFKTDGVEHNLYIGFSIAPDHTFDIQHLYQLRLWQLRVLCEMEAAHHNIKSSLPYPLEVTTLILVYHSTIDIRFRMDEKHFDVDGSYNARYEIVKKRIDKAFVKDSTERITQPGYITVVYLNDEEEQEYRQYIHLLHTEGLLEQTVEKHDVEDLQGVSGLKFLRIKIVHPEVPPAHLLPERCL